MSRRSDFGAQLQTLEVLKDFIAEQGRSPTMAELAQRRGITRQSVYNHVNVLIERGKLKRTSGRRNLRLTSAS